LNFKIKDLSVLEQDWLCPEIVDRMRQQKALKILINRVKSGEKPSCAFIYGKVGSGKTFVVRRLIEDYLPIDGVDYVYINLKEISLPSVQATLINILNALRKYFPIVALGKLWRDVPLRGWDSFLYIELLKGLLKQKGLHLILVLDEIDRLYSYEKNDDFMYSLITQENITPIFISNDMRLLDKLESRTRDRLSNIIFFSDYNMDDLYKILQQHIKYAIEGEIDDRILYDIAKTVWEGSRSAREAKLLLANYLKYGSLDEAIMETEKNALRQEIMALNQHQFLVLKAIIKRHLDIDKMMKRPLKYSNIYPTSGSIYDEYVRLCKSLGVKPKTYKTFQRIITSLELSALIRRVVTSLGRARGVTTLIYLGDDLNILKDITDKMQDEFVWLPQKSEG